MYFLTETEGGQKGLITEDFSTPIVFDVDQDLRFGLWSVVVKLHCKPNELRQAQGELYYLFHDLQRCLIICWNPAIRFR